MKLRLALYTSLLFALGIGILSSLMACSSAAIPLVTPVASPLVTLLPSEVTSFPSPIVSATLQVTTDMPPLSPDVFITPAQSGQRILVSVGQVIGVGNPSAATEWQVTYASEVLEILTASENVSAPGPAGWRFRAAAPGQTDLILTSIPQPCFNQTPCPPIPARFVFTIAVEQ